MTLPDPIRLDYAPPKPFFPWRRLWKPALVVVLLVCGWRWLPPAWHGAKVAYWRRQCSLYMGPAGQVVYEEDPAKARQLFQTNGGFFKGTGVPDDAYIAKPPSCLDGFLEATDGPVPPLGSIAFLHERTSPGGDRRLVILNFRFFGGNWIGTAGTCGPQHDAFSYHIVFAFWLFRESGQMLSLMSGQPDPIDASHFTIRYELGAQPGTIDGWLGEKGDVTLQVRDGPAK